MSSLSPCALDGMAGVEVMCCRWNDGGRVNSSATPGKHALIPSRDNSATHRSYTIDGRREEFNVPHAERERVLYTFGW